MLNTLCASSAVETLVKDKRQPGPAAPDYRGTLQGQWRVVQGIRDGHAANYIRGRRLIVEADRFKICGERGDMVFQGTIQVIPDVAPAQLDLEHADDTLQGTTWKGIYQLDGNTLRICTNSPNSRGPRPQEFAAPAGSRNAFILLRRI